MTEEVERTEEAPRRRAPRMVPVRIVERTGQNAALVQWNQGTEEEPEFARGYIPMDQIKDEQASERALKAAAPYAVDWAKMSDGVTLSPEELRRGLWNASVYTLDDLALKHQVVRNVLYRLCGMGDMIRKAKERK